MQYRFFVVPAKDSSEAAEELNRFLRGHRILSVTRDFVGQSENSYWAVAVEFLDDQAASFSSGKPRVDYKEVLSPEDFEVFTRLRDLRKAIAEEEGVPPYVVLTNDQLAQMARVKVRTKSDMGRIPGIGESKLKKYAIIGVETKEVRGRLTTS